SNSTAGVLFCRPLETGHVAGVHEDDRVGGIADLGALCLGARHGARKTRHANVISGNGRMKRPPACLYAACLVTIGAAYRHASNSTSSGLRSYSASEGSTGMW